MTFFKKNCTIIIFRELKSKIILSEAKQESKNTAARVQEESLGIQPATFRMTSHKRLGRQHWKILLKCPQGQAANNRIHTHTKGTGGRLAQQSNRKKGLSRKPFRIPGRRMPSNIPREEKGHSTLGAAEADPVSTESEKRL